MSDDDFGSGLNLPTYGDERLGDGLIRIQWRNGAPQLRTAGRFFVSADRLPDGFIPGEPWTAMTEVFESGDEVAGYAAEVLPLIILCTRAQPFLNIGEGRDRSTIWLEKWQKGVERQSMSVEVLCIARGLEELGPVVWSSRTVKTSFAIIARGGKGSPPGIVQQALDTVVEPMAKRAGGHLDTYCFWLPVGGEQDTKGRPVYVEAGSRRVTRPVLRLPAEVSPELAQTLWAGTAYIRDVLAPLRERYEPWRQERRTNDEAAEPVGATAAGGRNVPRAYDPNEFSPDDGVI